MGIRTKKKTLRRGRETTSNGKKERLAKNDSSNGGKKYFSNPKQALEFAFFVLFAAITVTICFVGQKPKGPQVIVNQPAPSRIVAEFSFTFESEQILEQKKASVSARVPPVFKRTFDPFSAFKKYIKQLNGGIAKTLINYESKDTDALLTEYKAEGEEALEMALSQTITDLASGTEYGIKPETIIQFTRLTNPRERISLTNDALNILQSIYEDGLYPNLESNSNLPQVAVIQLTDESHLGFTVFQNIPDRFR